MIKKILFYSWLSTSVIYFIVYAVKSFIIWEFTNPFKWIIDIPKMDAIDRGGILFFLFFYYVIQLAIIIDAIKPKKK